MQILLLGGGGREHAMAMALRSGDNPPQLLCAPGNGGTYSLGKNVALDITAPAAVAAYAKKHHVDLVVVGPEAALVAGVSDACAEAGIRCVGPVQQAARLEGSKAFCRQLAQQAGVPSPRFSIVSSESELKADLAHWQEPVVLKADGLAAGKGVFLPDSTEEALRIGQELLQGRLGAAGQTLVLEERLQGTEASLFFACDGKHVVALPHAQDYKRLLDGDEGPNTGGMGAISPNPAVTPELETVVVEQFIQPVIQELARQGYPFVGFLYAGLMLTADGPKLLEFNVRLGDPETQGVLPRLWDGEFLRLCLAIANGGLNQFTLQVDPSPTCTVVLAAAGYPEAPDKGIPIAIPENFNHEKRWFVHAGTSLQDGKCLVSGGRVGAVIARGDTPDHAREEAYRGVEAIRFSGMHYRRDIGA